MVQKIRQIISTFKEAKNNHVKMSICLIDLLDILLLLDISFHLRRLSEICKAVLNHGKKLRNKVKKSSNTEDNQETLISVS